MPNDTRFLRALFDRAVEMADPMRSLAAALPDRPEGRVVVIGAGKASARMAEAVEAAWGPCEGLVITRYGYARGDEPVRFVERIRLYYDIIRREALARGDGGGAAAAPGATTSPAIERGFRRLPEDRTHAMSAH